MQAKSSTCQIKINLLQMLQILGSAFITLSYQPCMKSPSISLSIKTNVPIGLMLKDIRYLQPLITGQEVRQKQMDRNGLFGLWSNFT